MTTFDEGRVSYEYYDTTEPIIVENGCITQITDAILIEIGPKRQNTKAEKTRQTILRSYNSEHRKTSVI